MYVLTDIQSPLDIPHELRKLVCKVDMIKNMLIDITLKINFSKTEKSCLASVTKTTKINSYKKLENDSATLIRAGSTGSQLLQTSCALHQYLRCVQILIHNTNDK